MEPTGGNFGQAIGTDSGALQEAMARRGMGAPATSVVSPAALRSADNPLPQPVPQSSAPGLPPQGSPGGLPPKTAESETIVKALDSRLKTLGKLQEAGIQV